MSKPYKTVSVCGCGWLGLSLAENLVNDGFSVTGSKRSEAEAKALSSQGIRGEVFDIYDSYAQSEPSNTLFANDVFVANIPPGRRTFERVKFVAAMKSLVDRVKAGGTKQFIFISTTSVYGNAQGEVLESTVCEPDTESGKAHEEIERYVLTQFPRGGVVLRLSGLVGDKRHPAKHMAGRSGISGGKDPVNLIHRDDCIQAVSSIIHQQRGGEIFHLSALAHPTRSEFYRWAAVEMGLVAPEFVENGGESKWISSADTLQRLSLTLRYSSPYDMPLPE